MAIPCVLLTITCGKRREAPVPSEPPRVPAVDVGSALGPMPICPPPRRLRTSELYGASEADSAIPPDTGEVVIVIDSALGKPRTLIDAPGSGDIRLVGTDSLGRAEIRASAGTPLDLRLRTLGYRSIESPMRVRPGMRDTIRVHLDPCV